MRTLWVAVLAIAASSAICAEEYTYADLLDMRTDLERLAVLPSPGERCAQSSSYDRRSRYDEATGRYVDWDANGDGHGMVRREGDRWVMAEMDGPGCIWRIWSARPGDGRVAIILDGAAEPAIDMPFRHYFDGRHEPFTEPEFVYEAAKGWNCYAPIPFQKSCKVLAEDGWGDYYHITYGTFPAGTVIDTFAPGMSAGGSPAASSGTTAAEGGTAALGPGETVRILDMPGPRTLTDLRFDVPAGDRDEQVEALRRIVLRIMWDGGDRPAVWAPLGDFFGTAPGVNEYESLPLGMVDGRMSSRWYMPFGERAVVELVNEGPSPQQVGFEIDHAPLARPIGELARFHAKWHRDTFPPGEPGRVIDWTLLKTKGRGRFVGVMLHVWNGRGGWWGEGDEKFFVDGEEFPSTFGTGSEDYFGYAWGDAALFSRPFHAQTYNPAWNRGHVSVNRWHIPDNVPFQESFEACIEKYFPNERGTLYAATAYWYLAPGGEDPYEPVPVEQRLGYFVAPPRFLEEGALEGEELKVLSITGGRTQTQDMYPFGEGWSDEAHLWWTGASPGDVLTLALPVASAGTYDLSARMTKAHDYGIVRLGLDGRRLAEPIDLYNPAVVPTGAVALGRHELATGEHELTVELLGANDRAARAFMFALDWIKLAPVPPAP